MQRELNLEEALLDAAEDEAPPPSGMVEELVPGAPRSCNHLDAATEAPVPSTGECAECVVLGREWVHLRQCLTCGHVGCCDSSRGRHAAGHFHDTDHPVMRSVEPGEAWRWCYIDRVLG